MVSLGLVYKQQSINGNTKIHYIHSLFTFTLQHVITHASTLSARSHSRENSLPGNRLSETENSTTSASRQEPRTEAERPHDSLGNEGTVRSSSPETSASRRKTRTRQETSTSKNDFVHLRFIATHGGTHLRSSTTTTTTHLSGYGRLRWRRRPHGRHRQQRAPTPLAAPIPDSVDTRCGTLGAHSSTRRR